MANVWYGHYNRRREIQATLLRVLYRFEKLYVVHTFEGNHLAIAQPGIFLSLHYSFPNWKLYQNQNSFVLQAERKNVWRHLRSQHDPIPPFWNKMRARDNGYLTFYSEPIQQLV